MLFDQNELSFRVIDQDSKQAVREAISIGTKNPPFNCNTAKMHIPEIFKRLL